MGAMEARPEGSRLTCAFHPDRETVLRCSRCERPICVPCAVGTPVGFRCRECARLQRLPTFQASPSLVVRGLVASLGLGAGVGLLWTALVVWVPFLGLLSWVLFVVGGYLLGEGISYAVRRRRGLVFQVLAGLGVLVMLAMPYLWMGLVVPASLYGGLAVLLAGAIAISRVR